MLIGLGDIGSDDRFDICIVGSGFAGISVALTLAQFGKRTLLLEGGDLEYSERSQSLYEGRTEGDPYFDLTVARLRQFGGTSGHWTGLCRTLDEADFMPKGHNQFAGWPIRKSDLDPYLSRASNILEIPPIPTDEKFGDSSLSRVQWVYSPPVRAGEKFRDQIIESREIFLVLNANVTELETNGRIITGIRVVDESGTTTTMHASNYVLATGGIENSRLLLWSNERSNGQAVKSAKTLGTHWMEHPHYTLGDVILYKSFGIAADQAHRLYFSPSKSLMDEANIYNCGLRLQIASHEGAKEIIADIACVAPEFGTWAMSMLSKGFICGARLRAAWEQEPLSVNRITLSNEVDAVGVPRVILHWRKSANDLRTVQTCALKLGEYFARDSIGRVRLNPWVYGKGDYPTDEGGAGCHHMGGTRMSDSPESGIVDSDCKVFGQENLFVAGSSVFPSGGHANPTLTIVQLALRLGDRLANL